MHLKDNGNAFEGASVNIKKIYDSCASKDYLENLRCFFTQSNKGVIDQAINVKIKNIDVLTVDMEIENLQFKNGFFSVNQTFFFKVEAEVISPISSNFLNALCIYSKKTTLFGSKSDVKTFQSNEKSSKYDEDLLPNVVIQVSKPILLSSSLNETKNANELEKTPNIPNKIIEYFGGKFEDLNVLKYVNISIGLFSIVHTERNVQMSVLTNNSGKIKECNKGISSKEAFANTEFPMNDFFPPFYRNNVV